jgi:hypothetical protein
MISKISSAQDTSAANAALQEDIRLVKANAPRQPAPETRGGGPYPALLEIDPNPDPRVKAIILHNSGLFPNRANRPELATNPAMLDAFHTPVPYVLGNRTDIAWSVATDDFVKINKVR